MAQLWEVILKPSSLLLFPLAALFSACSSSGPASPAAQSVSQSAARSATSTAQATAQPLAGGVVYDLLPPSGVVKAIGQNVRVGSPSTEVVLSAEVSSPVPLAAEAAVFGVRRSGTENHDIGWVSNYTLGPEAQTFTASGQFPPGEYTFWFAYLKDGQWVEGPKRAFTITAAGTDAGRAEVPLDPVAPDENAGLLEGVGADTKTALENAPVQFAAQLASGPTVQADQVIFAVRDSNGNNFDTEVSDAAASNMAAGSGPMDLGGNSVRGWRIFPAGHYTYQLAYRQGNQWVNLGHPRSFDVAAPAEVPVPPNASWQLDPALSDEFEGNSLDPAKWQSNFGEFAYPVSTYKDSADQTQALLAFKDTNVSVHDGSLYLTATKENYKGAPYTAGAVQSSFDIPAQPSYVEVRAKMLSAQANVLSAIWLQTFPTNINPNPEIDIQETFDYSKLVSTLHIWPDSNAKQHVQFGSNSAPTGVADVSQDYHVYGLERRDGWLRFYFDGKLAWQVKSYYPEAASIPRRMVFSLEAHLANSGKFPVDALLPSSAFQVDYIRTYTFKP